MAVRQRTKKASRQLTSEEATRLAQYEAKEAAAAIAWADDMVSGVISVDQLIDGKFAVGYSSRWLHLMLARLIECARREPLQTEKS
ncbi:MAG: hypothetical protein Q8O37_09000 [Sulfuricellaceae bacterium]|nr:hypothetical protein [Sulfuricellaceae bacterium]